MVIIRFMENNTEKEKEEAVKFSKLMGASIRAAAAFEDKSMRQLSDETGIEYVTLGRYLRGERDMPITVLYRCSLHLNTSTLSLVEDAFRRAGWAS